nr:reverse transcriptase domain-containing protein [Tanacetum cinerariifolium]
MEAFIGGLTRSIEGNVTASKPQTLKEAINIAQRLMDQIIKHYSTQETNDHKQKFEDRRNIDNNYPNYHNNNNLSNNRNNDNYQNNRNNNRNNDHHHQQNRKQETFRTYVAINGRPTIRNNPQPVSVTCNACGEKGHYANQCSKANNRATEKHT